MPLTSRRLAFQTLVQWTELPRPPLIPERGEAAWGQLDTRQRNFAFDLLAGIMRHRSLLDAVIASQLTMPLEQLQLPVRAILWLGSYELLLHRSVQAYATVHSNVELAKAVGLVRAAGLINAVLRNITRLQPRVEIRHGLSPLTFPLNFTTQMRFLKPVFPDPTRDHLTHLAVVHSHPVELIKKLIAMHGEPAAINILIRNNLRPPLILRCDEAGFQPAKETGLKPHESASYFVAAEGFTVGVRELVAKGRLSPQDPTAGKPVRALAQEWAKTESGGPRKICDYCAGLGTKAIQLARTFPSAHIHAGDIDGEKLKRLRERASQLRLMTQVTPCLLTETEQPGLEKGSFEVVLLDVPCSNTGVMSRRVQSRWRWPGLDLKALLATQRKILERGAELVAAGGLLVYSTCSIDQEENEKLVGRFIKAGERKFTLIHEECTLPAATDDPGQQHDGGYFAILRG